MKIETLAQALTYIPEYILLVPGVDKWKEGDEWLFTQVDPDIRDKQHDWRKIRPLNVGASVGNLDAARRPIPLSIREAEARWLLYNSLATVPARLELDRWEYSLGTDGFLTAHMNEGFGFPEGEGEAELCGLRGFESKKAAMDAVLLFGGEQAVIQMLIEGQGALMRWIVENRV